MASLAVREEEAAERMAEAEASLEAARTDAVQAAFLLGMRSRNNTYVYIGLEECVPDFMLLFKGLRGAERVSLTPRPIHPGFCKPDTMPLT